MIRIILTIVIIGVVATLIAMALKSRIVSADRIYNQSRTALADEGYKTEKVEGLNYVWIGNNPIIYSIDKMEDVDLLRLRFYLVQEFCELDDVNREGMCAFANNLNTEFAMSFFIDFDEPNTISMSYEARIRNVGDFMQEAKRFFGMQSAAVNYVEQSMPMLLENFPLVIDSEKIGFKIAKG